jgi:hypothetical protein
MAVPVLLYGSETWTLKKRDWNGIQETCKNYQRLHWGRTTDYRDKWEIHLQRMEQIDISHQAYKYRPSGRRDVRRSRRKWKEPEQTITFNPWSDDDYYYYIILVEFILPNNPGHKLVV